jgi:hypothetical protein
MSLSDIVTRLFGRKPDRAPSGRPETVGAPPPGKAGGPKSAQPERRTASRAAAESGEEVADAASHAGERR